MSARTLKEARREARRFVTAVLAGAFPDRPDIDPAGAREVLRFRIELRARHDLVRRPARAAS